MTANALTGDRARCLDAGMDAYISKPILAAELHQVLADLTGGKPGPERADSAKGGDQRIDAPAEAVADHKLAGERRPAVTVDKAALLARVGGREDRLRMIVQVFVNESAGLMSRIDDAIHSGDAPGLKLAAHSLKGAVGIFAVPRVVTLAHCARITGTSRRSPRSGGCRQPLGGRNPQPACGAGGFGVTIVAVKMPVDRMSVALLAHSASLTRSGLLSFEKSDFVAEVVEPDVVHEVADEKQAAAADAAKVCWIGGIRQLGDVESGALVADGERGLTACDAHADLHSPLAVGRLLAAFVTQSMVNSLVILAELGVELEVAVVDGVDNRFTQCDSQSDQLGLGTDSQFEDSPFDPFDERGDQGVIIGDGKANLDFLEVLDEPRLVWVRNCHCDDLAHDLGEVLTEVALRDVAGGAGSKRAGGNLFASVGGDEHDRNGWMIAANRSYQGEPIHARHLHVGDDNVGQPLIERSERLDTVGGGIHFKTRIFQQESDFRSLSWAIVDDEHACHV